MKILHIARMDLGVGGAMRATYGIHKALLKRGMDSKLLVFKKFSDDPTVIQYRAKPGTIPAIKRKAREWQINLEYKWAKRRISKLEGFEDERSKYYQNINENIVDADIIHLYWTAGSLDFKKFFSLYKDKKIVWRLSGMQPFTGGCNFSLGCDHFQKECGYCPHLNSNTKKDITYKSFKRKKEIYDSIPQNNLHFVPVCNWMAEYKEKSPLISRFNHTVINTGVNTSIFYPLNKQWVKTMLGIPMNKKAIVTVSRTYNTKKKGMDHMSSALDQLNNPDDYFLITIGELHHRLSKNVSSLNLGKITNNELLNIGYNAGDVFVLPSVEDNLPNTGLEALACGLPLIVFPVEGVTDFVEHGKNGIIVNQVNAKELAKGIESIFIKYDLDAMGKKSQEKALNQFSMETQINKYIELYSSLLAN